MSGHTPEPWEMEFDGDGYLINGIIRIPRTYEGYTDDAILILAAPDLLAACKGLLETDNFLAEVSILGFHNFIKSARDAAMKAIAKAEGRS